MSATLNPPHEIEAALIAEAQRVGLLSIEDIQRVFAAWNRRADGWQPIATADKNAPRLMLGTVRRGRLEEINIGGFRYATNEDEESCWWSDQNDDEICPTHWMPMPPEPEAA